jgi:hypothetical protein
MGSLPSKPPIANRIAHRLEIGIDMSRFPSHAHLISWAGICPRNDESAGKRRSNRLRKGAPWLKTTLVQCAWAAVKKKDSYLQAQFYRIKARRGPQEGDHGRCSIVRPEPNFSRKKQNTLPDVQRLDLAYVSCAAGPARPDGELKWNRRRRLTGGASGSRR